MEKKIHQFQASFPFSLNENFEPTFQKNSLKNNPYEYFPIILIKFYLKI